MALLQTLGLAPAKNAIRKLFRRPSPAGRENKAPSSSPPQSSHEFMANKSAPTKQSRNAQSANATTDAQTRIDQHQQDTTIPAAVDHYLSHGDKENQPPENQGDLVSPLKKLSFGDGGGQNEPSQAQSLDVAEEDPAVLAERAHHLRFIGEALDMARLALRTNETPVGCVLVRNGTIIAKGMNATNVTRNGTRHAEFMAISALLSYPPKNGPRTTSLKPKKDVKTTDDASDATSMDSPSPHDGNEDGSKSHLYPYGQKLMAEPRVDREIIRECILYVTVEPCVMCASLLRQLGIKKVYFGAVNDKFGGTGGVFSIHANSLPVSEDGQTASAHPTPRPSQLPDGSGTLGTSYPPSGGDGGNVEAGYEIEGGWGRDEAVGLLRRFYVQENGRAPVPRKKEGRAARLAAMLDKDGNVVESGDGDSPRLSTEGQDETAKENVDPAITKSAGQGKLIKEVEVA